MSNTFVLLNKKPNGVAELVINRPEVHNAFDDDVIAQLIDNLETVNQDPEVRVLVLRSNGKNFSAGADLAWMKRMAQNTHQENIEDAGKLARLMEVLEMSGKI